MIRRPPRSTRRSSDLKGGRGGKSHFKLDKDVKVKFEWNVRPIAAPASFRITVGRLNPRIGSYQTLATIFKTNVPSMKSQSGKLKKGSYQIYLAVKNMRYEVSVYREME